MGVPPNVEDASAPFDDASTGTPPDVAPDAGPKPFELIVDAPAWTLIFDAVVGL